VQPKYISLFLGNFESNKISKLFRTCIQITRAIRLLPQFFSATNLEVTEKPGPENLTLFWKKMSFLHATHIAYYAGVFAYADFEVKSKKTIIL